MGHLPIFPAPRQALTRFGRGRVPKIQGVEFPGEAFNAIRLDEANKGRFNTMVTSGRSGVRILPRRYPG